MPRDSRKTSFSAAGEREENLGGFSGRETREGTERLRPRVGREGRGRGAFWEGLGVLGTRKGNLERWRRVEEG